MLLKPQSELFNITKVKSSKNLKANVALNWMQQELYYLYIHILEEDQPKTWESVSQTYQLKVFHKLLTFLSANSTKWSNILKQFVGNSLTNCLSVFDHFVELPFKGLTTSWSMGIQKHHALVLLMFALTSYKATYCQNQITLLNKVI